MRSRGNKSMGNVSNSYFSRSIVGMMERACRMHGMVDDCVQNSSHVCREKSMSGIEAEMERKY
jgi:hypothetical protein